MEVELEFKRQASHGPLNYYLSKAQQLAKYQKLQISMIDIQEAENLLKQEHEQNMAKNAEINKVSVGTDDAENRKHR